MTGTVAPSLEVVFPVVVRRADGVEVEIGGVLDTGFDGELGLPAELLASLADVPVFRQKSALADGTLVVLDVYEVDVLWNGAWTTTYAQPLGSSLIGLGLCEGLSLSVRFVTGETATLR